MKTLVLVLGTWASPFPRLIRTIKQTWAAQPVAGTEVLFYYGGESTRLLGDDLIVEAPDGPLDIGRKTIACFQWCLANREFDSIFRTNCSSYVDLPNLDAYAGANARPERYYAGVIGRVRELEFASGSGYFLSRDLVDLVVSDAARWDHKLIDDASIANLLAHHGVRPEAAPRVDLRSVDDVATADLSQYHFRCRTDSWRRRQDVRIMRRLHDAFLRSR